MLFRTGKCGFEHMHHFWSLTMNQSIRSEIEGSILIVTIDRESTRNAIDGPMARALADTFRAFNENVELSVAVLTGANRTFCSGANLKAIASDDGNRIESDITLDGPMGPTRMMLNKPVIAAIEGHCVAGGLELALWCDMRVASESAVFGVYCRRWGVPLVDGGTVRLPRLIGQSHAMDMILTGRSVEADEALRIGLANRLAPTGWALTKAVELAKDIAELPQTCLRSDRMSAYDQWSLDLPAALAHETELGLATVRSGETKSGATRFLRGAGRHGKPERIRSTDGRTRL
jgi:enoyl-CoA hydratase